MLKQYFDTLMLIKRFSVYEAGEFAGYTNFFNVLKLLSRSSDFFQRSENEAICEMKDWFRSRRIDVSETVQIRFKDRIVV